MLISLVLVLIGYVFVSGCISSATGHEDVSAMNQDNLSSSHLFPPMYNYPKDSPVTPQDNSPGKFVPGDILQPPEYSAVFDRDIAVIVIRDTGDGSYEIEGISRSDGSWNRIPDSVRGPISHREVERLFPDKVGHEDVAMLAAGRG